MHYCIKWGLNIIFDILRLHCSSCCPDCFPFTSLLYWTWLFIYCAVVLHDFPGTVRGLLDHPPVGHVNFPPRDARRPLVGPGVFAGRKTWRYVVGGVSVGWSGGRNERREGDARPLFWTHTHTQIIIFNLSCSISRKLLYDNDNRTPCICNASCSIEFRISCHSEQMHTTNPAQNLAHPFIWLTLTPT